MLESPSHVYNAPLHVQKILHLNVTSAIFTPVNPSTKDNLNSAPPPSDLAKDMLRVLISQGEIPSLTGLIHFVEEVGNDPNLRVQRPHRLPAQSFTKANNVTAAPHNDEQMEDVIQSNVIHVDVTKEAGLEEEMVQPLLLKISNIAAEKN